MNDESDNNDDASLVDQLYRCVAFRDDVDNGADLADRPRRRVAFRDNVDDASMFEREEAVTDEFAYDNGFSEFERMPQPLGRIRIPVEELLQRSLDNQRRLVDSVGALTTTMDRCVDFLETIAANSASAVPRALLAPRAVSGAAPPAYSPSR